MITLKEAYKIAEKELRKNGYSYGVGGIGDTGDGRWIFAGRMFKDGSTVYGGTPLIVDKETGKFELFPLNDLDNVSIYCNSEEIQIPEI